MRILFDCCAGSTSGDQQQMLALLQDIYRRQQETHAVLPRLHALVQLTVWESLGPASSSASSRDIDYRMAALKYYHGLKATTKPRLRCMLLGEEFDYDKVIAAHIYQLRWNKGLRRIMELDVHDPRNVLLLVGAAEKRFHRLDWTLKPLPPIGKGSCQQQPYKVLVLNPELREGGGHQLVAGHLNSKLRWADLHGKQLLFGAGPHQAQPSRRACAVHVMAAVHHAKEHGWDAAVGSSPRLSEEDLTIEEAAWASPTFDKERIEAFLVDAEAALSTGPWCRGS
eukprot:GHRQ01008022.1.p1 GENE.GHRQ01008022.1~~GHRQ01008022.1.p1  ORF type:complete len:282 (+),score=84.69 GHRQ01008022.1:555-1400(+)